MKYFDVQIEDANGDWFHRRVQADSQQHAIEIVQKDIDAGQIIMFADEVEEE